MTQARVQRELFEQSVRGDLFPCVPPDRLDFAVERIVSNPHLRELAGLARNGEEASARLAEILARMIERADTAEAERDRLAGQVQRIREWTVLGAPDDYESDDHMVSVADIRKALDGGAA